MITRKELAAIDGCCSVEVCDKLTALATGIPPDQAIVEIGVYKARTLLYLAYGAEAGKGAHVWGIDPWDLPGERPPRRLKFTDSDTKWTAVNNVVDSGLKHRVDLLIGFSQTIARTWVSYNAGPVGLLHIDGDHSYTAARGDFREWKRHLADDAFVVWDDYGNPRCPDVLRVVDDLEEDGQLRVVDVIDDWSAVTRLDDGMPR